MNHKEQFDKASDELARELAVFVNRLRWECNCTDLEAALLARAILHNLLDSLGEGAMEEFQQFLATVREGLK